MSEELPMPVECPLFLSIAEAERERRLDCRRYDGCLTVAVMEKWESFTCRKCNAYDPPPEEKNRE